MQSGASVPLTRAFCLQIPDWSAHAIRRHEPRARSGSRDGGGPRPPARPRVPGADRGRGLGSGRRGVPPGAHSCRRMARHVHRMGACPRILGPCRGHRRLRGRCRHRREPGAPLVAACLGQRHSPCRGGAATGAAAAIAATPHSGEVRRRRPRHRFRARAGERGAERADGGERRPSRRHHLPLSVAGQPRAVRGGRRRRARDRLQCAVRGRDLRAGRIGAPLRDRHGHRRARRFRHRDRSCAAPPRRHARLRGPGARASARPDRAVVPGARHRRRTAGDRL